MPLLERLRGIAREGPFLRYMTGEAVSMTGTWMQVMAQSWVMTTLTSSATMLGLVNFALGIPMLLLALPGGVVADRYSRRNILIATQVVQIVLALFLGWQVAQGTIAIWQVVAVAFVLGVSNSFEMPAAAALTPELVGREQVSAAIAIERAVFHGTRLIGPAAAGYVIGQWGSAYAFYLNSLSFLALIAALFTLRLSPPAVARDKKAPGGFLEGWHHVRQDQPTLSMVAIMAATTIFVFPVMVVLLPLYTRNELHLGADRMGLLMGVSSLGAFSGSLGLLAIPRRLRAPLMLGAVLATTVALVGLSLADHFFTAAICLIGQSLGISTLVGLANTIVQERAPGPLRGRVSAVAGLSFFGLMPFASLGITSLSDALGMRRALALAGACFLLTCLPVLWRASRAARDYSNIRSDL